MNRVLLLNSSYEPITIISWRKAICLHLLDKVEVVEFYPNSLIRSVSRSYQAPAVVKLRTYVRVSAIKTSAFPSKHQIYERDGFTCQYCGDKCTALNITIDHVHPRVRGGLSTWVNMTTSCKYCNSKKGPLTPEEARMPLLVKPYKPKSPWLLYFKNKSMPNEWGKFIKKETG